ncbi:DUF2799 domain-containing protein [Jannaschia seohaensis]|uniref:Uncharacterized protein DUF2799 n=1 Tax=Jannaschia seohaensis TaxID=475081 RepID=A0A2Y9A5A0_9RHOB|nr:DUF2799 domain-containing protein [Jannaschia seohaensis]PWJ22350.1 uncharacterized protein DUF2799 [Jannaschia seohaensis]SSA38628.1 Protein of unknown function [Jannaschia seohaensis]
MRLPFVLVLLGGFAGCAELTEFSCAHTDPVARGERLARQGQPESALAREVARCAATPTPLSAELLAEGYARGRAIHCTPAGAFDAGHDGYRLGDFCPEAAVPELERANRRGFLLREVEAEIRSLRHERFALVAQLRGLDADDPDYTSRRSRLWRLDWRLNQLDQRRFLLRAAY